MHELLHGDCMEAVRPIESGSVKLVLTDPPYGIGYTSTKGQKIANDERPFIWWLHDAYRVTQDRGALLCFTRWDVQEVFKVAIEAAGWRVRSQVIWDRTIHGMGDAKAQFAPQHEVVWFATKGAFQFAAGRPKSVMRVRYVLPALRTHPTEKPVELLEQMILCATEKGETVLDPFMGTGATGVACARLKRKFIGIEMEEKYVRIARKRIEDVRDGFDVLPFSERK